MSPIEQPERAYYDIQSLSQIKQESPAEALEQASELFETHFLKTVLKHMRDATDALTAKDSPFSSKTQRFYRELGDEQLAQRLSGQGQLGLAHMLVKQFNQALPQEEQAAALKLSEQKVALNGHGQNATPAMAVTDEGLAEYASQLRQGSSNKHG